MAKSLRKALYIAFIMLITCSIFSCNSTKRIKYFQDIPDSGKLKTIPKAPFTDITIQAGDVMNVTVQTIDPLATASINSANLTPGSSSMVPGGATGASSLLSAAAAGSSSPIVGYLVDKDGFITLPVIGQVKAIGLTAALLKDTVYNKALNYYKHPIVTVSFANFKVNVMGEVLKPGQYVMPYEKATIFDALAMAGDLTVFGKRENVLLIRSNADGSKTPYRIDLKKSDVMSEPYFYLHQNDFIYVEPRKAKSDATDAAQQKYISIATAILSIIIILAYRVK